MYYGRIHTAGEMLDGEAKLSMEKAGKKWKAMLNKYVRISKYHTGEKIFISFPFQRRRLPTKRHVITGTVVRCNTAGSRYLINLKNKKRITKGPLHG